MQTEIIKIYDEHSTSEIERAAHILKSGGLVAFPTETVYGLGAIASSERAVSKIYKAKGRPSDNPLIVHIDSVDKMSIYAREIPEAAMAVFAAFAPGPITVVLKKQPCVPDIVSGGLDTIALRIPLHHTARAIIRAVGEGVAAPSANLSGRPSPTEFLHVREDLFGKIDAIVEGGSCEIGVESTVISLVAEPVLLRPGAVTLEMLREILPDITLGKAVREELGKGESPAAPGMKYRHYAPKNPLVLVKGERSAVAKFINQRAEEDSGVGVLCFLGEEGDFKARWITSFGARDNQKEQAMRIFDALRALDITGASTTYGVFPDDGGIGLAICNRLLKAAEHRVEDLEEFSRSSILKQETLGRLKASKLKANRFS